MWDLTQLLSFVLCAYGLTQILVYGTIFNSIRPQKGRLGELFECPMCMGFWVGVFLCGINGFTELFTFDYSLANFLICGWLSSGTSYIFNVLFCDNGFQIGVHNGQPLDK